MRTMQLDGESDAHARTAVLNYLADLHKIPRNRIKNNWFLRFSRWDGHMIACVEDPGRDCPDIIRHPDITVLDDAGKVDFVLEVDGSVHQTKSGAKQTEGRNADYKAAGVRCIIVDLEAEKALGDSWESQIDRKI